MNRSSQTIDLTGWRISDNHESDPIPSLSLPPGGFAVVAARADFYTNFPDFSGNIVFMADGSIGNGLSNTGDRLSLVDPTGNAIDALSYGDDNTVWCLQYITWYRYYPSQSDVVTINQNLDSEGSEG